MKKRLISMLLSITLVFSIIPSPVLAEALTPYENVEDNGGGVITYHNKDGSITIEVSLTDAQIKSMQDDAPDRLKEVGGALIGVDKEVDVRIETELNEDETLVTAKKDDMAVLFYPVIEKEEPADELDKPIQDEPLKTDVPKTEDTGDAQEEVTPEVAADTEENSEDIPPPSEEEKASTTKNTQPPEQMPQDGEEENAIEEPAPSEPAPQDPEPVKEETQDSPEPVNIEAKKQGYQNGTYSSVLFEEVFDNTDVEFSALKRGVKENIIINQYIKDISFSYNLSFKNLKPKQNGKKIELYDTDGNIAAVIASPYMTDAKGTYSEDIAVIFSHEGNGEYLLTYSPSDAWLRSDKRAYPVTVDPSVTYTSSDTYGIEDNYVTNTSPGTNHTYNATSFKVGNDGSGIHTAYIRPVIPDSLKNAANNVLITSASIKMYENTGRSGGSAYSIHQVTGGEWNAREITYNNAPSYAAKKDQTKSINGGGWVEWDITEMFSSWFNALDQKGNFGLALTADSNSSGDYREFASADTPNNRMTYSVTYFENPTKPNPTTTAKGNGTNSGTGYVELKWDAVNGANNYYVGIFNGKEYEYFYVGANRTFTTHNKGIWPTESEINAGKYALHGDGSGAELPMIPAFTYKNAGSTYANSIQYFFKVIPANRFGQAINPGLCTAKTVVLPDTMPPNIPASVTVSPSTWTNAEKISVSWSGVTDFNNSSGSASNSLGTGKIQYSIDGSAWKDTDKNTATGTYAFSTSGLEDGTHSIYIRGKDAAGNTGAPKGVSFYTDKTGPTAPALALTPDTWTKETSVSLTWSGIGDLNDLKRVEYKIDSGSWATTDIADKSYTGYEIDISSLASGEHTLSVRGVDVVGNNGQTASVKIYKDVDAPVLTDISADPPSWTSDDAVEITWEGLSDVHSGMKVVSYQVDDDEKTDLPNLNADDSFQIDVSALSDGEHTVKIVFKDQLDNTLEKEIKIYSDKTKPDIAILSPANGDIVNGTIEIWGSAEDISLDEWSLTASGSNGNTVTIQSGTSEQIGVLLGVLNTSVFDDGETIDISLYAKDKAGNENKVSGIVIKVDKSARPMPEDVAITSPSNAQVITAKTHEGAFETKYSGKQSEAYYYVDSSFVSALKGKSFDFDAIIYPENSLHSISVLSKDINGDLHYSKGLSAMMLLSDSFADEGMTEAKTNISYSSSGAKLIGTSGEIIFKEVSSPKNILALRLSATQAVPTGTSIEYYYTIDGGATWEEIAPGNDAVITTNSRKVQLKAVFMGDGTNVPSLLGIDLEAVIETAPIRATSKLLKEVKTLKFSAVDPITKAHTQLSTDSISQKRLFADSAYITDSFTVNALSFAEGSRHSFTIAGEKDGVFYASGGKTQILQRKKFNTSGSIESGKLTSSSPLYAVRLSTLSSGSGKYYYSLDGTNWKTLKTDQYVSLEKAAAEIWFKAEMGSSSLRAWHIEGVSASSKSYTIDLVTEPANIVAADYGRYYENEKLKKYVLTWKDTNINDETVKNAVAFEIYRNGVLIATTDKTSYTDNEYIENARYSVRAVKTYSSGTIPVRISSFVSARNSIIQKEPLVEGVKHNVYTFAQSEYLDKLYGGNYTFSTSKKAPTGDRALSQKLLGKNKYCAIGFEPVNFNTGNFLLETQDISIPDVVSLNIIRTYNTQSTETDGPFGAKWESAYLAHLVIYPNGDVGYRRADGSEIQFYKQSDGVYIGNDDDELRFKISEDETEYHVIETDGTVTAFSSGGLLKYIADKNGNRVTIDRDEDGFITAVSSPSGKKLMVDMDRRGHITKITTPEGFEHSYAYSGRNLVSYTDPDGHVTKYVYDGKGRMTEWYDGNGNRQVKNTYDKKDRVIHQIDANDGEYTLEYYEDHTVTTDATGAKNEIWFDSEMRTVKQVDAYGAETLYSYDKNGRMSGTTDASGRLTSYEYNEDGDKIKDIAPDGSIVEMEYDNEHHLTKLTDQLGNATEYEYDEDGNLLKQTNADGSSVKYDYDENGNVITTTDGSGNIRKVDYKEGNISEVTDALGNVTKYEYDRDGRMVKSINALGEEMKYAYDPAGNVTAITFSDGTSVHYTYDALNSRTSMTDPKGNVTKYVYDPLSQLIETTLPDGSKQTAEYDASLNNTSITNALGAKVSFTYDMNGNKVTEKDALGNITRFTYDEQNRLIKETLPSGAEREYVYDNITGLLIETTDETGSRTTLAYDKAGNLIKQTLANGASILNEYDEMNRLIRQTDLNGGVTEYAYDDSGNIVSVTAPLGGVTKYIYDKNGNVTKISDANGGTTTYEYDALGRTKSITDALGAKTEYEYDAVGNLIKTTDALGNIEEYIYDENGNMVSLVDAKGVPMRFSYDALGQLKQTVTKNGGKILSEYDAAGNLVKQTDVLGNSTQYEYNEAGVVTQITDALGQKAQMKYDKYGNVSEIISADGSKVLYSYDKAGRVEKLTDENGTTTAYGYDDMGNIATLTVNGNKTQYAYDKAGNIVSLIDAENREVKFTYDKAGNLLKTIYPDGTADTNEYDSTGRLLKTIPRKGLSTEYEYDANGNVVKTINGERETNYEYDMLGRLLKTTYPDGTEQTYRYDALGNLESETDAQANTTEYEYDAESLLTQVNYANGTKLSIDYDLAGNIIGETDGEGNQKKYVYDAVGRMTKVTDANGSISLMKYDAADNLVKVTDANGNATTYTHDAAGNLTSETDALGNTVKYAYTPEGWLEKITKADGKVITFTYDKTGNLLTEDYAGERTTENTYNEIGKLTTVKSSEGDTVYQYDDKGQLISVTEPTGETVGYTYDEYGRKASIIYPNGKEVKYTYDSMDRLTVVKGLDGVETKYEYDSLGQRVKTTDGALTTTYEYDSVGNLTKQQTTGKTNIAFEYAYNKNNLILSETRTEGNTSVKSEYVYDAMGQLTGFTKSDGYKESYSYDKAGNMLTKQVNDLKIQMTYNAANQMKTMKSAKGQINYSYDKNGNLTEKEFNGKKDTYSYDVLNQLKTYTGYDGYMVKYNYNALGILVSKESKGNANRATLEEIISGKEEESDSDDDPDGEWVKTEYIYDTTMPYYQVLQETTNGKTTYYDYGIERIAVHDKAFLGSYKTEYVYDGRGSVAQEVGYNTSWYTLGGAISPIQRTSKSYTPFGEQLNKKVSGYGFNAEYYDAATGMIDLRARMYEPAMNRFSQKDILKGDASSPASMNRYLFVENDPVNFSDPSGMFLAELWKNIKKTAVKVISSVGSTIVRSATYVAGKVVGIFDKSKGESIINNGKTTADKITKWGNTLSNNIETDYQTNKKKQEAKVKAEKAAEARRKADSVKKTTETAKVIVETLQKPDTNNEKNNIIADQLIKEYNLKDKINPEVIKGMTSAQKLAYICSLADDTKAYRDYWERTDGYFDGHWWQDREKLAEAITMLRSEASKTGRISIVELASGKSVYENNSKLHAIQALANARRTGSWDEQTLNAIETNLLCVEMEYSYDHTLTAEQIDGLTVREDGIIGREFGNWLENGGEQIIGGVMIIGGAIIYNAANGVYSSSGNGTSYSSFPNDPDTFNPEGLSKKTFNTSNGRIIKWFDSSGKAVYEWDEDLAHGAHYHIIGNDGNTRIPNSNGETHFSSGDIIP